MPLFLSSNGVEKINQKQIIMEATTTAVIQRFKQDIDEYLARREYFVSQVLPRLKEGQDCYTIKGKRSLAKGGAEKLASIYGLSATFERDNQTMEAFAGVSGLIAYVCNLSRSGAVQGQGRGASTLEEQGSDPNKAIKMAQKSAFIDAVIRTTGLSDIFTQDVENAPARYGRASRPDPEDEEEEEEEQGGHQTEDPPITAKQVQLLSNLIMQNVQDEDRREEYLSQVEGLTRQEASDHISEFLAGRGQ